MHGKEFLERAQTHTKFGCGEKCLAKLYSKYWNTHLKCTNDKHGMKVVCSAAEYFMYIMLW